MRIFFCFAAVFCLIFAGCGGGKQVVKENVIATSVAVTQAPIQAASTATISERINIGITQDFESRGIEIGEAKAVNELIIGELSNADFAKVVDRRDMNKILTKIKQESIDNPDALNNIKQENYKIMLSGSLMKLGDSYMLNIKLISIEKGYTIGANNYTFKSLNEINLKVKEIIEGIKIMLANRDK